MEHADEAQQEIFWSFLSTFPVFSAMAVSGAQLLLLLPSQQAGRLLGLHHRTQMATGKCLLNTDRADAILAKWQMAARAKQEQELRITLSHSPVAWLHLKKNGSNSKWL